MKKKTASVFAPATVGNVIVGFDILGLAMDSVGDTIRISKIDKPGVVVIDKILGCEGLPYDPKKNTATVGLLKLLEDLKLKFGFQVTIEKGIPLGSGMGGSAASAVGAIVAANAFLPKPLSKEDMMKYALIGEAIASGAPHGDNVAPCLFGGVCLVRSVHPVDVVSIPVPSGVVCILVHPNVRLDTREARGVLKKEISLRDHVTQSSNLAGFIASCYRKDLTLLKKCLKDILIEPQRQHLVPGFLNVQNSAIENNSLGCSISGAGPSVFALAANMSSANKIKRGMITAFNEAGVGPVGAWISFVNKKGAYIL